LTLGARKRKYDFLYSRFKDTKNIRPDFSQVARARIPSCNDRMGGVSGKVSLLVSLHRTSGPTVRFARMSLREYLTGRPQSMRNWKDARQLTGYEFHAALAVRLSRRFR
jgi:hypothetical protein